MKNQKRGNEWEKEWEEFELSLIKVIGAVKSDNVIQDHLSRVRTTKSFIRQLLEAERNKMVEIMEEVKHKNCSLEPYCERNNALDDLKSLLEGADKR